jgi:hypothetical protein
MTSEAKSLGSPFVAMEEKIVSQNQALDHDEKSGNDQKIHIDQKHSLSSAGEVVVVDEDGDIIRESGTFLRDPDLNSSVKSTDVSKCGLTLITRLYTGAVQDFATESRSLPFAFDVWSHRTFSFFEAESNLSFRWICYGIQQIDKTALSTQAVYCPQYVIKDSTVY